jgi:hypothetical protein
VIGENPLKTGPISTLIFEAVAGMGQQEQTHCFDQTKQWRQHVLAPFAYPGKAIV